MTTDNHKETDMRMTTYDELQDTVQTEIGDRLGELVNLQYSHFDTIGHDPGGHWTVTCDLDDVAFRGPIAFTALGTALRSTVYQDPTWLDLATAAEIMIRETGDVGHCFFEDFQVIGTDGNVTIARLVMGS
jgi:hypothetical protein